MAEGVKGLRSLEGLDGGVDDARRCGRALAPLLAGALNDDWRSLRRTGNI